jgi:hypothetical protein
MFTLDGLATWTGAEFILKVSIELRFGFSENHLFEDTFF